MSIQKKPLDGGREHSLHIADSVLWEALAPFAHVRTYTKDEAIIHCGDEAHAFWFVLKGWVKLTRQTPDGKETIIGLCTDGDVFGEAALFANADYPYNADAISSNIELAVVSSEKMRDLAREDTTFSNTIMSMLNERVSKTHLQLEQMSTMSTAQRLGCFLLRLCNHSKDNHTSIHIPVEKNILASFLGMKPETLSRSQALLKGAGVLVVGSEVNISSVTRLREFVCSSCSQSGSCETEDLS
jgi:CRP-like cAMP-binding protein